MNIRSYLLVSIFFFFTFQLFGQSRFSACTQAFIQDVRPYITDQNENRLILPDRIITTHDLYFKRGNYYVGVLILTDDHFQTDGLAEMGIKVQSVIGNLVSLRVPVHQVVTLSSYPGVRYIETGETVSPELEHSLPDTHADSVHLGLGGLEMPYRGEGVIIAIIDWGFDYTHPVFYDSTLSNLRISRAWDQNKMSGPHPDGYDFGTEYVGEQELLAAEQDTLYVFGPGSHGTHVAGIAGGNGGGTDHIGIAPEAELIFISLRRDAPSLADAFAYIDAYAKSVEKPYVVNMSFGSHLGPHDGTSLKNQAIDYFAGPGSVFVGSAGNNGTNNFHIKHDFKEDGDTLKTVVYFQGGIDDSFGQTLSMWGSENSSFSVSIKLVTPGDSLIYETPVYNSALEPFVDDTILLPQAGDTLIVRVLSVAQSPINNKPNIRMELKKVSNLKSVLYMTSEDSEVHIWNNVRMNNRYTNWGVYLGDQYPGSTEGNAEYGLGEPAGVGKSVITVASHKAERILPNGNIGFGNRSNFSSIGPTVDGRTKPDISGPGQDVFSSVNSFDPDPAPGTIMEFIDFNGKQYSFARYSGTSMSAPAVAGVVALMLQASPYMSAQRAKEIIKETARLDSRTGEIGPEGSLDWGWGKVNALAAVLVAETVVSAQTYEIAPLHTTLYPNPADSRIIVESGIAVNEIKIYSMNGQAVHQKKIDGRKQFEINLDNLAPGVYLLHLKHKGDHTTFQRFVKH